MFPATIAAWERSYQDEPGAGSRLPSRGTQRALAFAFLDSDAFDTYREHPFAGVGRSLEEAFFLFCEAEEIGDPIVRERELLAAMARALAVTPTAEMSLPDAIRRVPQGCFAVSQRGAPTLYATVGGRYLTGEITGFLAELLLSPEPPDVIAERHGVAAAVLVEAEATLRSLGLR